MALFLVFISNQKAFFHSVFSSFLSLFASLSLCLSLEDKHPVFVSFCGLRLDVGFVLTAAEWL